MQDGCCSTSPASGATSSTSSCSRSSRRYSRLTQRISTVDNNLKNKLQAFQESKNAAAAGSKKEASSILNRNLNELFATNKNVSAADFVQTNYLSTLVAIVPEKDAERWNREYENIHEYIVPKSSK